MTNLSCSSSTCEWNCPSTTLCRRRRCYHATASSHSISFEPNGRRGPSQAQHTLACPCTPWRRRFKAQGEQLLQCLHLLYLQRPGTMKQRTTLLNLCRQKNTKRRHVSRRVIFVGKVRFSGIFSIFRQIMYVWRISICCKYWHISQTLIWHRYLTYLTYFNILHILLWLFHDPPISWSIVQLHDPSGIGTYLQQICRITFPEMK